MGDFDEDVLSEGGYISMFFVQVREQRGGGASAIGVSPLPIVVCQCWGGGGYWLCEGGPA